MNRHRIRMNLLISKEYRRVYGFIESGLLQKCRLRLARGLGGRPRRTSPLICSVGHDGFISAKLSINRVWQRTTLLSRGREAFVHHGADVTASSPPTYSSINHLQLVNDAFGVWVSGGVDTRDVPPLLLVPPPFWVLRGAGPP